MNESLMSQYLVVTGFTGAIYAGIAFFLVQKAFDWVTPEPSIIQRRLESLKAYNDEILLFGETPHQRNMATSLLDKLVQWVMPFAQNLYGNNDKYRHELEMLFARAGISITEGLMKRFFALQVTYGILVGTVLTVIALVAQLPQMFQLGCVIGGLLLGLKLPPIRLKMKAKKRQEKIRHRLSDVLDLMVVCVEAGLSLDATIQRVAFEADGLCPELAHEFKRLNKEMAAGINRAEAFAGLGERTGLEELRILCSLMIQTDQLGTSVADTLRIYSDDIRTHRKQKAEELAAKASIKMTFPLVFFIFPPLFIVLIGPVVINTMQSFLFK